MLKTKMGKKKLRYEEYVIDGVRYIANRSWFANGKPRRELYYVDGRPHGNHRRWHLNGFIKSSRLWDMGVLEGELISNYNIKK
jgi:antitoxin component YwqK of YwqJK toxin-antitoxin module